MRLRTRYTQRLPTAPKCVLDIPMFEGSGTKVLDLSGKGNHGTITDALWTRDENGVAMSFNGTSAYVDCGNDGSLNVGVNDYTIEAWIKTTDTVNRDIVWKGAATGKWYNFRIDSDGKVKAYIDNAITAQFAISTDTVDDDAWHHVAAVFDRDVGAQIYIDGVANGALANISSNQGDVSTTNDFGIGVKQPDGTKYNYFNGTIDGVMIYAVALTAEQIKRRYEQTKRDYVRAS